MEREQRREAVTFEHEVDVVIEELQNSIDHSIYGYNCEIVDGHLLLWIYAQPRVIVEPEDLKTITLGIKNILSLNGQLSEMNITRCKNACGGYEIHLHKK